MTLLAFASMKGSPGVTTTVFAVTAALRGHAGGLIVDCDPAGGDVASRLGCPPEPGVVELATATRNGDMDPLSVQSYSQGLASGVRVVAAPAGGGQTAAALSAMSGLPRHPVVAGARRPGLVVAADLGRLGSGSPARPLVAGADLLALVLRPELDDVARLVDATPRLWDITQRLGLVIVGRGRYRPGEVAEVVGAPVLGELPYDRTGARLLPAAVGGNWAASRSRLARAAFPLSSRMLRASGGVADLAGDADARPGRTRRRRRRAHMLALSDREHSS